MTKPVGGRGKTAPYISTHVRIPEDIKPYVEFLKDQYYQGQLDDFQTFISRFSYDFDTLQQIQSLESKLRQNEEVIACQKTWIESLSNSNLSALPSFIQAKEYANKLLAQKKSARVLLAKLIDFIYGKNS